MKHILFTTFFSLTSCLLTAQFGPAISIDTSTGGVKQIKAADFNNDGQMDLLTSNFHWPHSFMQMYTRTGPTQFSGQLIAEASGETTIYSFDIGDINSDGWMDFVIGYGSGDYSIYWFENNAGIFTPHVIDSALTFLDDIMLEDFNNDGRLDVISIQQFELTTYMSLTPGTFDTAHVIHDNNGFYSIDIADYDGNGTPDIASGASGFDVVLNDGSGNFTAQTYPGNILVFALQSGDLDGDGDNDLGILDASSTDLLFYENDGAGNFQLHDTIYAPALTDFDLFEITDLDCDADQDVLITFSQTGETGWLENDGTAQFIPHQIHIQDMNPEPSAAVADMNADGITDVIWGSRDLAMHLSECGVASLTESAKEEWIVYPNPSTGNFTIGNTGDHVLEVQLTDMMGRTVFSGVIAANSSLIITVPQAGVYALNSISADGKLVVAKRLISY